MPDETPVPARVAPNEISSPSRSGIADRFSGIFLARDSQFTLENQREAHKSALERQQRVIQKHGDIRSPRQARQALRRVFPNLNFRDFFRGSASLRLDDTTFDMLVAMLDMGDQYPKVASRLLELLNDDQSKTRGGFHRLLDKDGSAMTLGDPTPAGNGLALNRSYDAIAQITNEENDPLEVASHWGLLMGIAMSDNPSEFSDEDMARVLNQSIAIHEFGHALHASYGYEWYGMLSEGKTGPTDEYKDSLFATLERFFTYNPFSNMDEDELEEAWNAAFEEMQNASPIKEPNQNHRRLIDVGFKVIDDIADAEGLAEVSVEKMKKKWINDIACRWFWDGYSDDTEKRFNVRKGLAKVSSYASAGAQTAPNTQYTEGVAETFTAQQFGYAAQSEAVKNHIIEIMEQARKVATQETKRYRYDPDRFKRNFDPTPTPISEIPLPQTCLGLGLLPLEKFADEDQINEKALGTAIGSSSDEPRDGDNDGKYSAGPGMPDETPMPPRLAEKSKSVVAGLKTISEKVTQKHGPLKTNKQIRAALKQAFPSARLSYGIDLADDDDASPEFRGHAIGLLYGADLSPSTAEYVREISNRGKVWLPSPIGEFSGYAGIVAHEFGDDDDQPGLKVDFRPRVSDLNQTSAGAKIVDEAKDYDDDSRSQLYSTYIALHEFGHLAQISSVINDSDYDPENPESMLSAFGVLGPAATKGEVGRVFEIYRQWREQGVESVQNKDDARLRKLAIIALLQTYQLEIADDIMKKGADGLDQEEKRSAIQSMGEISTYAQKNLSEAFAELFAARAVGLEPDSSPNPNVDRLFEWATKTDAASRKRVDLNKIAPQDRFIMVFCEGLSESDSPSTLRKLKGKALGVPIGAGDDEPDDGDGDGKYTAFPGGEDNVPMPPESLKEVVEWDDIADIINFDAFEERVQDDNDEGLYEVRQRGVDAWSMWGACRSIRKAAYELAGLSPDVQDPNIERRGGYFGGGWEMAEDDDQTTEYARYFMGELVVGARSGYSWNRRSLFRAVDVDRDESEEFEKAMSKGSIVDIPLLATADRRSQGLNEYLTRYGNDYLIEIESGAESAEAGAFDPMWSRRDEDDTLNRIEGLAQSIQDEIDAGYFDDDKDEKKEREQQVKILRDLVAAYERKREEGSEKRAKAREELAEAVSDYFGGDLEGTFEDGEGLNWEGELITEDDGSVFWDAMDAEFGGGYSETQPREHITGGRFEVVEVEDDPDGVYGKIIKLRQIGVFDPQNPGLVVPKVKKD